MGKKFRSIDDMDRMSGLPQDVLGRILGCLPVKEAVKTSILSKQWKTLWRLSNNLDFAYRSISGCFWSPHPFGGVISANEMEKRASFRQFMDRVFSHYEGGSINRFSLTWLSPVSDSIIINASITSAITRNVRKLVVMFNSHSTPIPLPLGYIFNSSKLSSLELIFCRVKMTSEMQIHLPSLKRLTLVSPRFEDTTAFENLIRGCPAVTHVYMRMEAAATNIRYVVSSASLRHLRLEIPRGEYVWDCKRYSIDLDTPSLQTLKLRGPIYWIRIARDLKYLTNACVAVPRDRELWDYDIGRVNQDLNLASGNEEWDSTNGGIAYFKSVLAAVDALKNATVIRLGKHITWALSRAPGSGESKKAADN